MFGDINSDEIYFIWNLIYLPCFLARWDIWPRRQKRESRLFSRLYDREDAGSEGATPQVWQQKRKIRSLALHRHQTGDLCASCRSDAPCLTSFLGKWSECRSRSLSEFTVKPDSLHQGAPLVPHTHTHTHTHTPVQEPMIARHGWVLRYQGPHHTWSNHAYILSLIWQNVLVTAGFSLLFFQL